MWASPRRRFWAYRGGAIRGSGPFLMYDTSTLAQRVYIRQVLAGPGGPLQASLGANQCYTGRVWHYRDRTCGVCESEAPQAGQENLWPLVAGGEEPPQLKRQATPEGRG